MTHRAFMIGSEGRAMTISKTVVASDRTQLHLDELVDGTWRLSYNDKLLPEFAKLKRLVFRGLEKGFPAGCKGVSVQLDGIPCGRYPMADRKGLASVNRIGAKRGAIHFDRAPDGRWRLLHSDCVIADVQLLDQIIFLA